MIFTKGAHQSAKFQTFDCSGEISPNMYFDRLLLVKVYKISDKKVQKSYILWYWRVVNNLKENRFFVSKKDNNLVNFDLSLKSLTNFHLDWFFFFFDLKMYRGVIFYDTEESCKIWRKTDLWLGKWHEKFGKFSSEHLKVSKLLLSWYPFVQSRK